MSRLMVFEVIRVAKATTQNSMHNEILVRYTIIRARELSRWDARKLASATTTYSAHDDVLAAWQRENGRY
jgi:hypothetical protein